MSGRQLSLCAVPVACPRATAMAVREKGLAQLLRLVVKYQGEDDFWSDHIATFELAARVGRPLPAVALDMAELRRRGVVKSHGAAFDEANPPNGSMTCWYRDESPSPRPYRRPRVALLPPRLDGDDR